MSIFDTITNKIFHYGQGGRASTLRRDQLRLPRLRQRRRLPLRQLHRPSSTRSTTQPVDVEAVLKQMAQGKAGLNWQSTIGDLLKQLDMDLSLAAGKELAGELNVHVGDDGIVEENIVLHKAVVQTRAENGGKGPDNLRAGRNGLRARPAAHIARTRCRSARLRGHRLGDRVQAGRPHL